MLSSKGGIFKRFRADRGARGPVDRIDSECRGGSNRHSAALGVAPY